MTKAKIVVGSIWGDEGKGITTDYLTKRVIENNEGLTSPERQIVVRFSGGQQAGHNVVIDDRKHVHSNFGSGTLRGVPSYFSHHCTVYPVTIYREAQVLNEKLKDGFELYIHPLANVTTPADVAYNRLTERTNKHGSCGLGVGATLKRNIETPYKVYGIDLLHVDTLERKHLSIYWYYRGLIGDNELNIEIFDKEFEKEQDYFFKYLNQMKFDIQPYEFLNNYDHIQFEGSQGILLDMDHGIFPNVTYGNTTSKNAIEICKKLNITDIEVFYITRCYQTRHGEGWMSNEEEIQLTNNEEEINKFNEWQKEFKVTELDYDLLNQAHAIDNIYSEGIRKNLVVTCLDQRPDFIFDFTKLNTTFSQIYRSYSPDSKDIKTEILY